MRGKCLCGQVEFEILGKPSNLYQCHCSLCKKATGAASSASMITGIEDINWITGKDKISSFTKDNGFRSDFCSICGSPVPNKMNVGEYMWIPAGLLEGPVDSKVVAHIYTESKATWEQESCNCKNLSTGPENIETFMDFLQKDSL